LRKIRIVEIPPYGQDVLAGDRNTNRDRCRILEKSLPCVEFDQAIGDPADKLGSGLEKSSFRAPIANYRLCGLAGSVGGRISS